MYIPSCVQYVLDALRRQNHEACLVGGCVRDMLMGRIPNDYDVATGALPEEVRALFSDCTLIDTGIKHGTVCVVVDGQGVEVTTFRADGRYTDLRRPDSVRFTRSLREDAARRDFTVNALALSCEGEVIDYFGGRNDIEKRIIRCVGAPRERFGEDALRILRALRFASVLGFTVEPQTEEMLFTLKYELQSVARERIADELIKLLCGKNAAEVLVKYISVLAVAVPELSVLGESAQKNSLLKTVCAVAAVRPEGGLRLAALLHGVKNSNCAFWGGEGDTARKILNGLKLDRALTERVCTLIKYSNTFIDGSNRTVSRMLIQLTPEVFFELIELKRAIISAQCDEPSSECELAESAARNLLERRVCLSHSQLAVDGNFIMAHGVPEGRAVGRALDAALQAAAAGELENTPEAIADWLSLHKYI